MRPSATLLILVAFAGCGGATLANDSPCLIACNKMNTCRTQPIPCAQLCSYGGHIWPGLAPAPSCPALEEQRTCVRQAVKLSCDAYVPALSACPSCLPLVGSACASHLDCAKFDGNFRCDLGRPGGYCTAPCVEPDDCSFGGPEVCTTLPTPPDFAPLAPATQKWCMLGCPPECRTAEGYACIDGLCDHS
jgi:hypothetical protein